MSNKRWLLRPHSALAAAITDAAERAGGVDGYGPTPIGAQVVEALACAHELLDLPDSDDDTALLRARLRGRAGQGSGGVQGGAVDVVLTPAEDTAHARRADRMNAIWALANSLNRFAY